VAHVCYATKKLFDLLLNLSISSLEHTLHWCLECLPVKIIALPFEDGVVPRTSVIRR
jgi:hypothetical protein